MNKTLNLMSDIFGFSRFRDGQEEVIKAIIAGKNVLAIMPTGGGKSLCYQLPALQLSGVTLVISPLIALMRDQISALRAAGVSAGALTSGNTEEENEGVFAALDAGDLKLLYIAPERLANSGTIGLLRRINTSMIAVDEAHCVSQWGHDFRPDYLRIGALRAALNVPLAAFSATADSQTRAEIVTRLFDGTPPEVFLHGFDRPNIHLAFAPKNKPRQQLLNFVNQYKGLSGIIYCSTRNKTEVIAQALAAEGHSALAYHAGLDREARRLAEIRFQREDGLIVCATVAFGMGIDKPDIRYVLHADLPKSIESYYQEIGRSGRDGEAAYTLTLYGPEDIRLRRSQIDEGAAVAERKQEDHARLNTLLGLAEARHCRRRVLLRYFGEEIDRCDNCDLCAAPPEIFDGTTAVQMALSAILRTGEYFGAGHLTDVLLGNETAKIKARNHNALSVFGVGKDYDRGQWQAIFRQMMGYDLIRPDAERYGAFRMTENARPILRGEESIDLRKDALAPTRSSRTNTQVKALVASADEALFDALKAKRRKLAEAQRVPAYVIFTDRTLIAMASDKPHDLDGFARLSGVGAKKLKQFGPEFLQIINGPVANTHPARQKLAGQSSGTLFDKLQAAQLRLRQSVDGTGKPMQCSASLLAKLAAGRPQDMQNLTRILGESKAERFGFAFLEILRRED